MLCRKSKGLLSFGSTLLSLFTRVLYERKNDLFVPFDEASSKLLLNIIGWHWRSSVELEPDKRTWRCVPGCRFGICDLLSEKKSAYGNLIISEEGSERSGRL